MGRRLVPLKKEADDLQGREKYLLLLLVERPLVLQAVIVSLGDRNLTVMPYVTGCDLEEAKCIGLSQC